MSLSDYAGKYVVVYFYPLDFTFVCPTEIIAFSDRIQEFKDIGCEVAQILPIEILEYLIIIFSDLKKKY